MFCLCSYGDILFKLLGIIIFFCVCKIENLL